MDITSKIVFSAKMQGGRANCNDIIVHFNYNSYSYFNSVYFH